MFDDLIYGKTVVLYNGVPYSICGVESDGSFDIQNESRLIWNIPRKAVLVYNPVIDHMAKQLTKHYGKETEEDTTGDVREAGEICLLWVLCPDPTA